MRMLWPKRKMNKDLELNELRERANKALQAMSDPIEIIDKIVKVNNSMLDDLQGSLSSERKGIPYKDVILILAQMSESLLIIKEKIKEKK